MRLGPAGGVDVLCNWLAVDKPDPAAGAASSCFAPRVMATAHK
jgi:hypothetical protein